MKDKKNHKQRRISLALAGIAAVLIAAAAWTLCRPGSPAKAQLVPAAPAGSPYLLDLNDAAEEELICLPGIGPATAAAILDRRDELGGFRTREDVLSVSGIGEATYEKIEPYISY